MSPRKHALVKGTGEGGMGVAEYVTERHIFNFVEMKVLKLFFLMPTLCLDTCLAEPYVTTPLTVGENTIVSYITPLSSPF